MANEAVRIPIEAVDNTRAAFNSVNANLDKTAKNAKVVTGSFGRFRGASQQLGFQIQDVAVQLKSGTDASVVFAQQGSQIASIFGPAGAVVGALIAVGAAVAGPFISSILGGTNALKEMEAAADDVAGGLIGMTKTERIQALAANQRLVAEAQDAIAEATTRRTEAQARLKRLAPGGDLANLLGGKELKERIDANNQAVEESNRIITQSSIVIEKAAQSRQNFNDAQDAAKIREVNAALREQNRLTKELAAAEKEAGSRLLGINQANIDASIKERREKKQNKEDTISFLDDQLAASAQNSRKMFAVNKAFRIAQATMQTYEAATKLWPHSLPPSVS